VTTNSPSTCDFFRDFFLSALPKQSGVEDETTEQSGIALLLRVQQPAPDVLEDEDASAPGDWGITELLIYGAITYLSPSTSSINHNATPPNSSPDPPPLDLVPVVSVHALPLSSRHNFAAHFPIKPEPNRESARFIAPNPQDIINPVISRSTKKRRAEALDRAVKKTSKKQKLAPPPPLTLFSRSVLGGSNINAGNKLPTPDRENSPEPLMFRKRRASGLGIPRKAGTPRLSAPPERPGSALIPRSRAGTANPIKKEPSQDLSEAELANRDVLSKLVLKEMEVRGLRNYRSDNRRTKSIMPAGGAGEDVVEFAADGEEKDALRRAEEEKEEFKNIFHHTVKAAAFALRKDRFSEVGVSVERMREVVRMLFGVFLREGKENDTTDIGSVET
jgi:hypothetical protein